MRAISVLTVVLAIPVAAGCGNRGKGASGPAGARAGDHPELTPEMTAYHDVLAPLWHSEPQDLCPAERELVRLAGEIEAAPPPDGVEAAAWTGRAAALVVANQALSELCASAAPHDDRELGAAAVHDAFHALLELLPGGRG
jgi:hypothetical protein